jgi:hypothetical protein
MTSSRPLRAVEPTDETVGPGYTPPRAEKIGEFEGEPISFAVAKLSSANKIEVGDRMFKTDQKVVMVIELRVNNIAHPVNETTGLMTRVHGMKVIDAFVVNTDFETLRESGL